MTEGDDVIQDNAQPTSDGNGRVAPSADGDKRHDRTWRVPSDTARRETGLLAAAVTAVPLLVASSITIIPLLGGVWPTAIGIAILAVIIVVVAVQIVRSARKLLIGEAADAKVVEYRDNRETGILLKGKIANVSLRASTIHSIINALTIAIPPESRQEALYSCGRSIGKSWASDFRRQLTQLEIRHEDIFQQLLKWSEYDATAGMGRLSVAVNPLTAEGTVTLANGFLSREPASFPLIWWFAGYLAGTLDEILQCSTRVEVVNASEQPTPMALFQVFPVSHQPEHRVVAHPIHHHAVARGKVWLEKLRRPLPWETA
jgi:hypothetical protein